MKYKRGETGMGRGFLKGRDKDTELACCTEGSAGGSLLC